MTPTLFDSSRMTMAQAVDLTVQSLNAYGSLHDRWAVAWSGGKDSSTLLTLTIDLIRRHLVPSPRVLHVLYADTRMELPPLAITAKLIMAELRNIEWIDVRTVMAPLDERYFVYMLGRGVPPPNNNTLRWCTAQIKVEPMQAELDRLYSESTAKVLMLIGVRIGESAARDARIALACGRNGAECGQGWYQRDLSDEKCAKLSPILHWRTCQVWDWLMGMGTPDCPVDHGFSTQIIAEAYGQYEEHSAEEINARTGCICCPLASRDTALDAVIRNPAWSYLAPLKVLRDIYRSLRDPSNRLRQPPGETKKDGSLIANQNRMGPLTMLARLSALNLILAVQSKVNAEAQRLGRPEIDILNAEEEARIRELIAANTWPRRWSGDEPIADLPYVAVNSDGTRQLLLTSGGEA